MQKLDEHVLANTAAVTAFLGSLLFYLFYLVSPNTYSFFMQARLAGGNVGDLTPAAYNFGDFLQSGVGLAVLAWVMGLIFARVYNAMSKSRGRSRK